MMLKLTTTCAFGLAVALTIGTPSRGAAQGTTSDTTRSGATARSDTTGTSTSRTMACTRAMLSRVAPIDACARKREAWAEDTVSLGCEAVGS